MIKVKDCYLQTIADANYETKKKIAFTTFNWKESFLFNINGRKYYESKTDGVTT